MSFRGAGGCSIVFLSGLAAMPLGGSFVLLFLIRSAMSCSIRRRRARRAVAAGREFHTRCAGAPPPLRHEYSVN